MVGINDYLAQKWPEVFDCYNQETLQQLEQAYSEPHRGYHGTSHVIDLLNKLEDYKDVAKRPDLIVHAILWHDAVYRTHEKSIDGIFSHRPDALNVEESACWLEGLDVKLLPEDRAKVASMIRATAGHDVRLPQQHSDFNDTALFLDLDLSVLALPYDEFVKRTMLIRIEYPHVSDRDFCVGRTQFLDDYGMKDALFFHPVTAEIYDSSARENMRRQAFDLRQQAETLTKRVIELTPSK